MLTFFNWEVIQYICMIPGGLFHHIYFFSTCMYSSLCNNGLYTSKSTQIAWWYAPLLFFTIVFLSIATLLYPWPWVVMYEKYVSGSAGGFYKWAKDKKGILYSHQ